MLFVTYFAKESDTHVNASAYSIKGNSDPSWLMAPSIKDVGEVTLQETASLRRLQIWELIFPTPSIPTGWFRIRNTATNSILTHRFTHKPPFLIPDDVHQATAPCNINCCNGSCDKATQWALVHGQLHARYLEKNSILNRYFLINRLTGGFLADLGSPEGPTQVCCWSKAPTQWLEPSPPSVVHHYLWEVWVATPPHIWYFRNRESKRVLAEVVNNQHVSCVNRSEGSQAYSHWRVELVGLIFIACLEYLSIAY